MRIVNITGGLGNQMFQYAFGILLKERHPEQQVLIDTSHYHYLFLKKIGAVNLHNGFEIHRIFPHATLPIASAAQIWRVSVYLPNYWLYKVYRKVFGGRKSEIVQPIQSYFAYQPEILDRKGHLYYDGIWESISYYAPYRAKLQHVFSHPQPSPLNEALIRRMETTASVGIHVRRGDYLHHPGFRWICEEDYYRRAIAAITDDGKQHVFYVFTNDKHWCEQHLCGLLAGHEYVFVENNKGKDSCWDLFLMTHCQDLIIANSSFSWWGAFLNSRNGRVVTPRKWMNRDASFDIWDEAWIRV